MAGDQKVVQAVQPSPRKSATIPMRRSEAKKEASKKLFGFFAPILYGLGFFISTKVLLNGIQSTKLKQDWMSIINCEMEENCSTLKRSVSVQKKPLEMLFEVDEEVQWTSDLMNFNDDSCG